MRLTATSLIICIVFSLSSSRTVVAQQPHEDEVLLLFRYAPAGNFYVNSIYNSFDDRTFLPVTELFNIFQIVYQPDKSNFVLKGFYFDPDHPFTIDIANLKITRDQVEYLITPDDFRVGSVDIFLSPKVFEKIFGLSFTVNINYLTLSLETALILPVQEKAAREAARKMTKLLPSDSVNFPIMFDRKRKIIGGALVDYSFTGNYTQDFWDLEYAFTGGMEVLGGDLQGTVIGNKSSVGSDLRSSNLRWRYVARNNPWFSALTLGQLSTGGLIQQRIRGFSISNDPVEPRKMYDNYVVDGHTVPESEVELYLNERLVGYMRADELGYYRFEAPVSYGTSSLSTRIYTPTGEVKTINREIQVPFMFLPVGVVTYNLQGGSVENFSSAEVPDEYAANGNIAVGVTRWLTLLGGTQFNGNEVIASNFMPYGSVSARFLKQYLFNIDLAPQSFYRATASVMYPSDININVVYTHYTGPGLFNYSNATNNIAANLYCPFSILGLNFGIRLSGEHITFNSSAYTRYNSDLNARIGRFNIRVNYRDALMHQGNRVLFGDGSLTSSLTYTVARTPGIPVYIQGMFLRVQGQYDLRLNELIRTELQVSRTMFRIGRLNVNLAYDFMRSSPDVEIGMTLDFAQIRSFTTGRSTGGTLALRQSFTGSLGIDARSRHIEMSNREQVSRACVSVISFVDNNNTGIYDKGDEVLPYNSAVLDDPSVTTIARDGIQRISQLQSYYRYNLTVNRNAIPDATLIPGKNNLGFVTDPNQYKRIEIPFYRGGIIEGKVLVISDSTEKGLGGLRLLVKGIDSDYNETIRTFNDGNFYAMDIPPGKYSLQIDPTQLEFIGARQENDKMLFEIKAVSQGDYLEGITIVLLPKAEKE